jgi:hypothetical protein
MIAITRNVIAQPIMESLLMQRSFSHNARASGRFQPADPTGALVETARQSRRAIARSRRHRPKLKLGIRARRGETNCGINEALRQRF